MKKILFLLCMIATLIMYQSVAATTLDNHWVSGGIGQIQPHDGFNGGLRGFGQTFTLQVGDDNQLDDITIWLLDQTTASSTIFNWALYEGDRIAAANLITDTDVTLGGFGFNPYMINTGGELLNRNQEYSWWITSASGFGAVGTNNGYAGGHLRSEDNLSGTLFDSPTEDLAFVMNLSDPSGAAVPEPATMLLLGFGLLGITGVNRRKK